MQRLLQSVAKAIARQARGLLERKAQVREGTRVWSEPQGRRDVGSRARPAPVGAVQKSAEISWPVGASRRGRPKRARRLTAILEISDGSRLSRQSRSRNTALTSRQLFELSLPPAKQLFEQCSALVHACVRVNGAGPFIHDPLDSVS